jgi:MATE family, multidrug efflux pump
MSLTDTPTVGRVARLSLPLMLSLMSVSLMMFGDRVMVARYSPEAMTAVVAVTMFAVFFEMIGVNIASICEVFVGRFNGAGEKERCGRAVWQMVWFSLATAIFYWPIAQWAGEWVVGANIPHDHGVPYFRWMVFFAPVVVLNATFSSFFVGIGRVKMVTVVTILANVLNLGLDYIALFELKWGTGGAALATGLAQLVQALVLGYAFLRRHEYGSRDRRFRPKLFLNCLRIGAPNAMGHSIEIGAWVVVMQMMAMAGPDYLAVQAVGVTCFSLFAFTTEGLHKGVASIASNLLGAGKQHEIPALLRAGGKMLLVIVALSAIPLAIFPEFFIHLLIGSASVALMGFAKATCLMVLLYFLLDGTTWLIASILMAGGDTRFIAVMNGISSWFFCIVPMYVLILVVNASPTWIWPCTAAYATLNAICFYLRYRRGKWQQVILT